MNSNDDIKTSTEEREPTTTPTFTDIGVVEIGLSWILPEVRGSPSSSISSFPPPGTPAEVGRDDSPCMARPERGGTHLHTSVDVYDSWA